MKTASCVILPLSLLTASCSDTAEETAPIGVTGPGHAMSRMDHEEFCSSIRRVSKEAANGFATLKSGARTVPGAKTETMSRVYREYQEDETWFHLPAASDCHIASSMDRPPGKARWANYRCRWRHATLDEAGSAFRDMNRHIGICMEAEDIKIMRERDGQKIAWRIFRAPDVTLNLFTAYHTESLGGESVGPPVLDLDLQAGMDR